MPEATHISTTLVSDGLFRRDCLPIHVNLPLHRGDTPLHDHDFWEATLVLGGQGMHRTVQGTRPVSPGDVVVVRPGEWHAWEGCRDLELANCLVGTAVWQRQLSWIGGDPHLQRFAPLGMNGAARQNVGQYRIARSERGDAKDALLRIRTLTKGQAAPMASDLLTGVLDFLSAVARGLEPELPQDQTLAEARRAMLSDPTRDWSVGELATIEGISQAHFSRRFKELHGEAPIAWLARLRVEQAAVLLLTTQRPIAAIGAVVGWPDPNYFTRRFRAIMGQTPSTYRSALPVPSLQGRQLDWVQW